MGTGPAVEGGEPEDDGLVVVGREVESHGGPVFPNGAFWRIGVPSQRVVGHKVGRAAGRVDNRLIGVEYLQPEARLVCMRVVGVLQHHGVAQYKERVNERIDVKLVCDRLRLGSVVPVAQSHRTCGAGADGVQPASRAGVGLSSVSVERVTALMRLRAIIDLLPILVWGVEPAGIALAVVAAEILHVGLADAGRRLGVEVNLGGTTGIAAVG